MRGPQSIACVTRGAHGLRQPQMKYWGYTIAVAAVIFAAYILSTWLRYASQRSKSRTWPAAPATIEGATVGFVSRGIGVKVPAVYFNYRYSLGDRNYTGLFLLSGGSNMQLKTIKDRFTRKQISVRYDPAHPSVSVLDALPADDTVGFKASQNPFWLRQAPVPSIEETIKFS
jgi:Protein of unknown function (DUF3592)